MMTAPLAVTKPQAGVMTTRPATAPEQKPSTLGLPRVIHSSSGQTKEATAVASVVVVKALAAMPSAATALPALKPYQPTHSMPVPTMRQHHAVRREVRLAEAEALAEDQAEDQRRPAGGHVHDRAAREIDRLDRAPWRSRRRSSSRRCPRPCAPAGSRRRTSRATMNRQMAENFMRSAMAPTISAGVMIANIS